MNCTSNLSLVVRQTPLLGLMLTVLLIVPDSLPAQPAAIDPAGEASAGEAVTDAFDGTEPGQAWDENEAGIVFCWCPPGTFTMGSPVEDADRLEDEGQVTVELTHGIWMGKYEVTQQQYAQIMDARPWQDQPRVEEGPGIPATFVSWQDANEFCRKLTALEHEAGRLPENWEYRLPSEAQWEYACRAGTQTRFCFREAEGRLAQYAWYHANTTAVDQLYAHEVGGKRANDWNLHDMHGNVWEWCQDGYQAQLPGGEDPLGSSQDTRRIVRGGAWGSFAEDCRSAARLANPPSSRSESLGFRVALVLARPAGPPAEPGSDEPPLVPQPKMESPCGALHPAIQFPKRFGQPWHPRGLVHRGRYGW